MAHAIIENCAFIQVGRGWRSRRLEAEVLVPSWVQLDELGVDLLDCAVQDDLLAAGGYLDFPRRSFALRVGWLVPSPSSSIRAKSITEEGAGLTWVARARQAKRVSFIAMI